MQVDASLIDLLTRFACDEAGVEASSTRLPMQWRKLCVHHCKPHTGGHLKASPYSGLKHFSMSSTTTCVARSIASLLCRAFHGPKQLKQAIWQGNGREHRHGRGHAEPAGTAQSDPVPSHAVDRAARTQSGQAEAVAAYVGQRLLELHPRVVLGASILVFCCFSWCLVQSMFNCDAARSAFAQLHVLLWSRSLCCHHGPVILFGRRGPLRGI